MINLTLDFLNRLLENKIEIYNKVSDDTDKDIEEIKIEFLNRYRNDVDFKILSLIIDNYETVLKYTFNELKVLYKLEIINERDFYIYGGKESINLNIDLYQYTDDEKEVLDKIVSEINKIISGSTRLSYCILYLLPFKNGDYYKLGITGQKDLFRIKHLDDLYSIDFEKATIFYGLRKDIQLAENYLKQYIPQIYDNPYQGMDGFSEIREMETFEDVLTKCKQFTYDFGLLKQKLKDMDLQEWKNTVKVRPKKKEEVDLEFHDMDFNIPSLSEHF